jgi:nucleoid-associated protein YgaU
MKRFVIISILMMCLVAGIFAQSLENNEFYLKSLEYEKLSAQALDSGEYVQAQEYAVLAQQNAALSRQYIADMLLMYRARSSLTAARARINLANQINLKASNPDLYNNASEIFAAAENQFNNEDYESSYVDSRRVIELLAGIDPRFVPRDNADEGSGALAANYRVKEFPGNEDCLWKIASYSYIYGDAGKWRHIYDANKDAFPEPENPNLILPGMILKIPSIQGEVRSGTR